MVTTLGGRATASVNATDSKPNMMSQNILVWDIESVPDLERFAIANDLVGKPDSEIRENLGDKFPKHIFHFIVCIGSGSAP
jgi:hypothetical protein